jgi:Cdc6-like AAA superfamily ATPase
MATPPSSRERAAELTGRRRELDVLDRLIEAVRAGESRVLVVRGEPGVGKTAVLEYIEKQASGCRVEDCHCPASLALVVAPP